ncbi:radical SAM family heme chaperone HemW [Arthrobacter tumbae]|uniref:radical SAM family heme chaperone HemW n=1 Tax=Arthrobacter tumbae TaxID=163874 RepID=UPI00195878F9|nr:radical SAM family heme chaperone HemW [Arthrobacter tumbae]MBM7783180.1 oxygen-independent coproporphyrinogen-3 oxidase [Arthrobacter tumbae]
MPSTLPLGDPAPADGLLPASAAAGSRDRAFGLYVHIPFCAVRCGYCDFNTYTAAELGGGASQASYALTVERELEFAAGALEQSGIAHRALSTVFFGGGTPTLLPSQDLARVLQTAKSVWGLEPGAEVTTEANPDSVTPESLAELARAGFTRVSFGMQSAVPHVLALLDRTHAPERVPLAVEWARAAGLKVSLDLIYGTPGEELSDWERSLEAALVLEPDHLSAYALIIEEGTALARRIRRGEVPMVDDDDHADKYEIAENTLRGAGMSWYEVSNWARHDEDQCRHNLAYWKGHDWWGAGPGAHSHVGGTRWWNVKHPAAYAQRLDTGATPAAGREILDETARYVEDVLLRSRLAEGYPVASLRPDGRHAVAGLIADGLIEPAEAFKGIVRLSGRGRLLANAVVRRLLPN